MNVIDQLGSISKLIAAMSPAGRICALRGLDTYWTTTRGFNDQGILCPHQLKCLKAAMADMGASYLGTLHGAHIYEGMLWHVQSRMELFNHPSGKAMYYITHGPNSGDELCFSHSSQARKFPEDRIGGALKDSALGCSLQEPSETCSLICRLVHGVHWAWVSNADVDLLLHTVENEPCQMERYQQSIEQKYEGIRSKVATLSAPSSPWHMFYSKAGEPGPRERKPWRFVVITVYNDPVPRLSDPCKVDMYPFENEWFLYISSDSLRPLPENKDRSVGTNRSGSGWSSETGYKPVRSTRKLAGVK